MHTYKLNNLEITEMSWSEYQRKKKVKLLKPLNEQFNQLKEQFNLLRKPTKELIPTKIKKRRAKRIKR